MALEEFRVEQNTGYIAPVSADSSVAQVEDTKRRAYAEQMVVEKEAGAAADNSGNAEGNILIDLGLEALGVKSAASLVQFADERMSDRTGMQASNNDSIGGLLGGIMKTVDEDILGRTSRKPGTYQIDGEDLVARSNIASSSLSLDPKHVNTDKWGGTDTKLSNVSMAKAMTFRKEIEHELLPQIRGVEMQHAAMIGQAQRMAPGLGMMNGPSINPQQLLNDAERIAELEDWQRRMQEAAGA